VRYTACILEKRNRATQRLAGNEIEFGDTGAGGRITLNG
jgi:hypothetical protein